MTSGAHVSPFDTGCHNGSFGRASSLGSHVTRSEECVTWMLSVRSPVAYAYHSPSTSRMKGSAKFRSMTGFVNVPAAGLADAEPEGEADGDADGDPDAPADAEAGAEAGTEAAGDAAADARAP